MKKLLYLFAALASVLPLQAQKLMRDSLNVKPGDQLNLDFKFADDIHVHVWNKQEVLVKVSANINDNKDNDLYNLIAEKSGNHLHFYSDNKWIEKFQRRCDSCNCNCNCNRSEIHYEVYMPATLDFYSESISGDLDLDGLTGRIHINTISGSIKLKSPPQEVDAKTISGDVEFLLSKTVGAEFNASTISGSIYSNCDIEYLDNQSGLRQVVGSSVKGKINGGGSDWTLNTISGNIYLRQI